jgi:hypothetical protein
MIMKKEVITFEESFFGLNKDQLENLRDFYKTNPKLLYKHRKDYKENFESTKDMMQAINLLMPTMERTQLYLIKYVTILEKKYLMMKNSWVAAFFEVESGACHVYHAATWKSTSVGIWVNSYTQYNANSNPSNSFYRTDYKPSEEDIKLVKELPEFKYIDFEKLKYVNFYPLLNNRFQKEHLWQIEMLIKSGYTRLATELASSYENIDFKLFKQYQDFFKLRGKGLWHYRRIIELKKQGFEDPEFMFLDISESYYYQFWIRFLVDHPEINRRKLIKYIKGRKTTATLFGEVFLDVYKMYLGYIYKIGLDLSKDKFTFPEDLIEEFKDILLVMEYSYSNGEYKSCLLNWQSQLEIEQMDLRYADEALEFKNRKIIQAKEKQEQQERMRKAKEEMKRTLELIWQTNRLFNVEINEDYILIAPKSSDDLYVEGKTLNHCVYDYLDRIAKKETAVLFIRKKKYPDKPFYTVEVRNEKVVQCRSTNNLDPANVAQFFSNWINDNISDIRNRTEMAVS